MAFRIGEVKLGRGLVFDGCAVGGCFRGDAAVMGVQKLR